MDFLNSKKKGKFVISLFKQIFTWWHRQTLGTFLYTLFFGKFVGVDEFKNKYYTNSKGKRWVIYKDRIESSKIPPQWHLWIHFLNDKIPENNLKKYEWQKQYQENLTGTDKAYKPKGSLASENKSNVKKYENWKF